MGNNSIPDTIDTLISKNLSFALYYPPGEEEPDLVIQTEGPLFRAESYEELNETEGFVFAPFTVSTLTPLVVIRPDLHLKGFSAIAELNIEGIIPNALPREKRNLNLPREMNKTEYTQLAEPLLQMIREGEFEKVVLSRTIFVDMPEKRSLGDLLLKLKVKVDNAFVCLVHLPEIGTWMGATPELLLKKHNGRFLTVSLAGTLPINGEDSPFDWTSKELREQEIVTEFIETQLRNFGIDDYHKTGPFTSFAGNVAHLKTEFDFPDDKVQAELGRFITALHPTSAVCGTSREKARSYILAQERHNREYYCGFLGEWNLSRKLNLYVNLRCMKILGNRACLFVGGGITADSVPENEWEETNHKAKTLLSILT
jgi:isochorismate synthase